MARVAVCPDDGAEMTLQHRGDHLEEWHCDGCGSYRAILPVGAAWRPEDPMDALRAEALRWVEREMGPRFGRIDDEEGG